MLDLIGNVVQTLVIKKRIVALKSEIAKKLRDVQYMQDKVATVRKKSTDLKTTISATEKKLAQSRQTLKDYREEKAKVLVWLEKLKEFENTPGLLDDKKRQVQVLMDSVKKLSERFKTLDKSYKEISKLKQDLTRNTEEKTKAADKLSNEVLTLQQQKDQHADKPYLTASKDELTAMQTEAAKKIKELQQEIKKAKDAITKSKSELTKAQANLEKETKEKERLSTAEKELEEKIAYYTSIEDKDVLLADIDELKKHRIAIIAELEDKQRKIHELEANIESTNKAIEDEKHFVENFGKRKVLLDERRRQVEGIPQKLQEYGKEVAINERVAYQSKQLNAYIDAVNELIGAEVKGIDKHFKVFEEAVAK
ncbi:hypothetical protein MBAV_002178 [Candidatus Magnetobacterium bavaricum]|nr:hypothetical protein MBAV_002178 [Candidatus Magnetobacterium bavaricum]